MEMQKGSLRCFPGIHFFFFFVPMVNPNQTRNMNSNKSVIGFEIESILYILTRGLQHFGFLTKRKNLECHKIKTKQLICLAVDPPTYVGNGNRIENHVVIS